LSWGNQYLPYVEVWQRNEEHPENSHAWFCHHYGSGKTVELAGLNIRLPMAEIYEDLDFPKDDDEYEE
jgi:hypothetical protein